MMKKNYEKPTVEVVKFQYRDQVVAASFCTVSHILTGSNQCEGQPSYNGHSPNP